MSHSTAPSRSARPGSARRRRLLALATAAAVALGALGLAAAPAGADAAQRSSSADADAAQRSGPADAVQTGLNGLARPADAVQTSLDGLVRSGEFPGVLAAVRGRDGRTRDYTAGVGNLETGVKVPVNGRVRIGSNTKTFVAVVVLQLADEGRIDLDAPVEKYLPGLVRGNGNDGRRFTTRQMLQHTAGLANYTQYLPPFFEAQHTYFEPRELLDMGLAHKPVFAPGKSWQYSNTGYVLLGLLVQKVTGRPISEEVTNRIIKPLGLRDTYWPVVGEQTIRGAHPHGYSSKEPDGRTGKNDVDVTEMDPSWGWAAGQLVGTPRDVNRFLGALLDGRLLKPALLEQMKQTVEAPGFPDGWSYGLGLMKIKLSCGGHAWGHGGDIHGYETRNGVTEDGRSATVAVTALPLAEAGAERVNAALDTALCAQK
ncbi:serine hydrolase domain-containing protein [Streptosporangium roseum]|uniref:serine hydrolase domain-containing protein n=1 Tax=Streptosporangium roseum TaxID=2001 RepID=UPI00332D1ED6